MDVSKKDWSLYRERLPEWQERYMERLIAQYKTIVNSEVPASDKFWELDKRIRADKKKPGVVVEMSKQEMIYQIVELLHDKAITFSDLDGFSEDLISTVQFLYNR